MSFGKKNHLAIFVGVSLFVAKRWWTLFGGNPCEFLPRASTDSRITTVSSQKCEIKCASNLLISELTCKPAVTTTVQQTSTSIRNSRGANHWGSADGQWGLQRMLMKAGRSRECRLSSAKVHQNQLLSPTGNKGLCWQKESVWENSFSGLIY